MTIFIRLDAKAPLSPEVGDLAGRLNIGGSEALGLIVSVYCHARIHCPTGIVKELGDATLEGWAGWRGRKGRLAAAFRAVLVTPTGRLQGWRAIRYGPSRAPIPPAVRRAIFARDAYACVKCGSDSELQIDHIEPWCDGGTNELTNLQTLCANCNQQKGPPPWSRARASEPS